MIGSVAWAAAHQHLTQWAGVDQSITTDELLCQQQCPAALSKLQPECLPFIAHLQLHTCST
jgi:hypothetical protein